MAEEIRANSYCGGGRWGYIFKELRDLGGNVSWFGNVNLWKSTQASIQERCQNRGRHNWADAHQEGSLKTWKFGGIWGGVVRNYVLCLLSLPPDGESEESGK